MEPVPSAAKLVCFDLETSDYGRAGSMEYEIIQIGAVYGQARFSEFVRPTRPIDAARHGNMKHGITDSDVEAAHVFLVVLEAWCKWMDRHVGQGAPIVLVGFNNWASDDKKLHEELRRHGQEPDAAFGGRQVWTADARLSLLAGLKSEPLPCICPGAVHILRSQCASRSLGDIFLRLCGAPLEGAHDAAVDAEATRVVLRHYSRHLQARRFSDGYKCKTRKETWVAFATAHVLELIEEGGVADSGEQEAAEKIEEAPANAVSHGEGGAKEAVAGERSLLLVPQEDRHRRESEIEGGCEAELAPNEGPAEAPPPSPKRQRLFDRHYEPFIVSRPCFCGEPYTWHFDCQCRLALEAQPRLRAELGVA